MPSIARLFVALQYSESIHARNFKGHLAKLGVEPTPVSLAGITVADTQDNLEFALAVERAEIDAHYPGYIGRIQAEAYQPAIDDITYAWKAEHYFVCNRCGSTLVALPENYCPICKSAIESYVRVASLEVF